MNAVSSRELRIAGLCHLAIIALSLWTEMGVRGILVVAGDAAATGRTRLRAVADAARAALAPA